MALQCDYNVSWCAISQYDLLAHACGPPAHKFTQDMGLGSRRGRGGHRVDVEQWLPLRASVLAPGLAVVEVPLPAAPSGQYETEQVI